MAKDDPHQETVILNEGDESPSTALSQVPIDNEKAFTDTNDNSPEPIIKCNNEHEQSNDTPAVLHLSTKDESRLQEIDLTDNDVNCRHHLQGKQCTYIQYHIAYDVYMAFTAFCKIKRYSNSSGRCVYVCSCVRVCVRVPVRVALFC